MDRYIGIDVHSQTCTVAVMSGAGKHLREFVVETNGRTLMDAIKGIAGDKHVCLEEGTQSNWVVELLQPIAARVVVIQPEKRCGQKSDSVDARHLAERLRLGGVRSPVFKPGRQLASLRDAVRGHQVIQRDLIRAKNRLRAIFRSRGIAGLDRTMYGTQARDGLIGKLPATRRTLAELLYAELDRLEECHERAEKWLLSEAHRSPAVRRLETVPGLGWIRAAQVVAVVVTPHRFRTKRQFWSYCGLSIVTRSSGDWVPDPRGRLRRRADVPTRGLTRKRNGMLKCVFKGAALTVVQKLPDHPLHQHYQRLVAGGTGPHLARLTLARRIAAVTLAIWKREEDYEVEKHVSHILS
jgi:transposase